MTAIFLGGLFRRSYPQGTERDIAYGTDSPLQKMDVYHPVRPNGKVIFMVHGGGWQNPLGDKANDGVVKNKVAYWVAKGYVLVSINYRLYTAENGITPLNEAQDAAKALAFAQSKARSWGANPKKFILMGHSAGAHLVALLTSKPDLMDTAGATDQIGTVCLDSAAMNIPQAIAIAAASGSQELIDAYAPFGDDVDFQTLCSPYHQLNDYTPPMCMVYSTQRGPGDKNQTLAYQEKAEGFDIAVTVIPQNLSHGQIDDQLGLPGDYTTQVDKFIGGL